MLCTKGLYFITNHKHFITVGKESSWHCSGSVRECVFAFLFIDWKEKDTEEFLGQRKKELSNWLNLVF